MKFKLMLLLFFTGCRIVVSQDLKQTILLALENNPSIHAVEQQVQASDFLLKFIQRRTLPALQAKANYRYQSEVMELDLSGMPLLPMDRITLGARDTWETGLTLSWVLFSGFAQQAGIRKSRAQSDLARIYLGKTRKEVALQTAIGYRTVQGLLLHIQSLNAAIQRTELQEVKIKSLVDNGMALGVDTLSIALAKLNYRQQLLSVQAQHETAAQQLDLYTGAPVEVKKYINGGTYNIVQLLSDHVDALKILTTRNLINQQEKIQARSKYFPAVVFQASGNYGKPGVDFIRNEWMSYAVAGIGVQWDIWNWGATKVAAQARTAASRQTLYELEDAQNQVRLLYDTCVREYNTMQKQLTVLEESLNLAREKMRIVKLLSEQGMVSATEFNDTNLELTQAEIAYQQQLVKLAGKIHELDYKSGRPMEEWYVE